MAKKEYQSVGIIIVARDTNKFFMLHRVNYPVSWSALSGGMELGENPTQTIKREISEEIGLNPNRIKDIKEVGISDIMGHTHHVMVGFVDTEFEVPRLDKKENDSYGWFTEKNLPSPLHPGFRKSLEMVKPLLDLRESLKIRIKKLLNGTKFN